MKFCSNCGETVVREIPLGDNRLRFVCKSCGTIHYQNPRMIVGVLPTYKEKVLLCQRAIEPRKGLWTLPAGFLENNESTVEGAIRECFEESCARVVDVSLYGLYDIPHIHQVYVFYRARMENPNFSTTEESSDVRLFLEEDIPWDQLAFPVIELTLNSFFKDRKIGRFPVKQSQMETTWRRLKKP